MIHFLLVHGLGHGAWCWYVIATLLRSAGHHVTTVDLAAAGINPKQLDEIHTVADYSAPLMEAIAPVPDEHPVVLVGHSFGGVSVALAMEQFPKKVAAAVFVSAIMPSVTLPLSAINEEIGRLYTPESFMDSEVTSRSIKFGPKFMAARLYQLSPAEDLTLATLLVRPGTSNLGGFENNTLTQENYGKVRRVYVVTMEDRTLPEKTQRWLIAGSPETEVKVIERSDHMVMFSKPRELCQILLEIGSPYQQ